MEKLVTRFIDEPAFEEAHKELDNRIGLVKKFSTSLSDTERHGLRTMGEGREGFVRTVSRIALTHVDCMPRNENPEEMEQALAYYDKLASLLQKVAFYHELVDDTLVALSNDIMGMADRYTGYLQTARAGNNSLDMALDQVDAYNKRFAARSADNGTAVES